MREPVLNRSFVISFLLHAGLVGLLLFLARPPLSPDRPIRVRFVEPPPIAAAPESRGPAPQPAPRPAPRPVQKAPPAPPARSGSSEQNVRDDRVAPPAPPAVSPAPRPVQTPEPPSTSSPPPQVASRPAPEVATPPIMTAPRDPLPERDLSDRSGFSLGGPPPAPPGSRGAPGSPRADSARPSLRDQIAGLGSGVTAERIGPAERTISLGDREPRYLRYLAHLKRRIESEWLPPEDARRVGAGGEVILVFTLNPTGSLTFIRLVESSGFPTLDNESLRSVKAAAPFDAFPREMGGEPVNIVATFTYGSPARYRRN